MMVVDTSVWIDFFNGRQTPQSVYLRDSADRPQIIVGDLILCEVYPSLLVFRFSFFVTRCSIILNEKRKTENAKPFCILQGFRQEKDFHASRELLLSFHYRDMVGQSLALEAARHYRALRARGITVRKTIDVLIGTFCLINDFELLHDDRDFDPMETHLGLRVVRLDDGDTHS